MALVDFTNPAARAWYAGKLQGPARHGRGLLQDRLRRADPDRRGLARRLRPAADAQLLHPPLQPGRLRAAGGGARRGRGGALRPLGHRRRPAVPGALGRRLRVDLRVDGRVAARRAVAGLSGFGFWSHDIGGFEGTPDPAVFKRWVAFGLLSSHSRLHGSDSYRVPWAFDEEAVDVLRHFTRLKCRLMPYLFGAAEQAHRDGRADDARRWSLEFPDDPACDVPGPAVHARPDAAGRAGVQRRRRGGRTTCRPAPGRTCSPAQRLTGPALGARDARLRQPAGAGPAGRGDPVRRRDDRPDYDWADGVRLRLYAPAPGQRTRVRVPSPGDGPGAEFDVSYVDGTATVELVAGASTGYDCERGRGAGPAT